MKQKQASKIAHHCEASAPDKVFIYPAVCSAIEYVYVRNVLARTCQLLTCTQRSARGGGVVCPTGYYNTTSSRAMPSGSGSGKSRPSIRVLPVAMTSAAASPRSLPALLLPRSSRDSG
jgi:hypothetical protein